eukprot:TRINITY_DN23125_c0_g1_i1.p1 TRINITY_DN23125_c0_g1~~TRINITY_DN23125_c0_g1_i1.p1  ORF type:complete len:356 (+),score=99.21 TRINITY_DN23125_c0_g1_i1:69-1070(+)
MEVNYDATVYFLYKKHNGDMRSVAHSFRSFMKFANTLGGEEAARLGHVDEFYYTEEVLEQRVAYYEWKLRSKREKKKKTYEKDTVFGGLAIPSGHNILKGTLDSRMEEIADEVRKQLPSIGMNDEDDASSDESLPEVFFSGIDWDKVKLPGDEGFSWDAQPTIPETQTVRPTPHQNLAKTVLPRETLLPPSTITADIDTLNSDFASLRAGDMSSLKRALNPNRPPRPSQCSYDVNGDPITGINPAPALPDTDAAELFTDFMKKTVAPSKLEAGSPPSSSRSNRWTIIEHSDSSSDEDPNPVRTSGVGKGKGKGKGGKGSKGGCVGGHRGANHP